MIDFGTLFFSGLNFKYPEIVNFRLTKNMIEPLGKLN
jgi:phosphatidylinositol kinase/protein kinase (PI-3  family)